MVDTLLVVVTVISLVFAGAMGVIVWRVLRLEQKRAEERIASLAEAADEADRPAEALAPRTALVDAVGDTPVRSGSPWNGRGPEGWDVGAPPASSPAPRPWTDLVMERTLAVPEGKTDDEAAAAHLFRAEDAPQGNGRRLVAGFALAATFLVLAGAVLVSLSSHATAVARAEPAPPPLELLSLGYERAGGEIAIRGIVRNPLGRGEMRQLVAVVFLFDKDGRYLGTLKQPVLENVLMPGANSPFEVSVSDRLPVGRYRLTFHAGGTSVPHLDRRPATDSAPKAPAQAPAASSGAAVLSASAVR